jgi:hypothetical protein
MSYQDDKDDQDDTENLAESCTMKNRDDTSRDESQDSFSNITDLEESAFYESGLTAHGCMDNLDSYAMESIKRYGMILFKAAYKDATTFQAYKDYTGLMLDSNRLKEELAEIKERCEKLEKAMKYSPSGESLLSKFIQATQDIHEAREEIRLLKAIMDVMKDKANE